MACFSLGSCSTAPVVVLLLLLCSNLAASLHADSQSQTLRREIVPEIVQIGARGEIMRSEMDSKIQLHDVAASRPEDAVKEFCDFDFPLGHEGTNNCTNPANESLIMQEAMCIEAARLSSATTTHGSFRLSSEWEAKHPRGCFKDSCSEAANGICYFFDGDGSWPGPLPVSGSPVCSRPRHLNGTKDSAAADGGCPAGYKVLDDHDTCWQSAGCLDHCRGGEFRTGTHNATKRLVHPRGCFIDNTDGCVYYNGPSDAGTPSQVQGTPICIVESTTQWSKSAAVVTPTTPSEKEKKGTGAKKEKKTAAAAEEKKD